MHASDISGSATSRRGERVKWGSNSPYLYLLKPHYVSYTLHIDWFHKSHRLYYLFIYPDTGASVENNGFNQRNRYSSVQTRRSLRYAPLLESII